MLKYITFIFFMFFVKTLIEQNIITRIPMNVFNEFSVIFYITSGLYYVVRYLMSKYSVQFNKIQPSHKKMYVVKNYIKSFFLAGLCTQLFKFSGLLTGTLDVMLIKKCAIYYVMNDIIGLLLVKKLPSTTKIHHLTTTICGILIVMYQTNKLNVLTLIVLYAMFSSLAFCVNFYLGLRIYSSSVQLKRYLSNISFWVYLVSCLVNWVLQAFLAVSVIPTVSITHTVIYLAFLYSVGKDDIILMKWLYDDHKKFKEIMQQ